MTRPVAIFTAGFSLAMLTISAFAAFGARWIRKHLP